MTVTPINTAEAVLDPFWDPRQSELSQWTIGAGEAHGLEVAQNWCNVVIEWAWEPDSGPVLEMHRSCEIDCSAYDGLVLSLVVPPGSVVRLFAETNLGRRDYEAPPAGEKKREIVLELEGATQINEIGIKIDPARKGIRSGHLNWLGLRNTVHLARLLEVQSMHDGTWPVHLKSEEYAPDFRPTYGFVFTADEITALRARHEQMTSGGADSPFLEAAEQARSVVLENLIHEFVNFWGDTRYNRERDHCKHILTHGLNAAIAGHLTGDASLLRLAARYAMSIGMCDKWDDGFICFYPGSDFEHRCFVQSLCAFEVAAILDLAGEFFTDVGRDFLLRRLVEEAIGSIYYTMWRHEYIYSCNQLAWFTPGRMLAGPVAGQSGRVSVTVRLEVNR